MRVWLLFSLLIASVFAKEVFNPYDGTWLSIVHSEYEQSIAKENNDTFPNDANTFTSWYNTLNTHYNFSESFYVTLGAKANVVLSSQPYEAPFYLRSKLSSDELNRGIISEASLNYSGELFSLSVGRNALEYDWLLGSMDGVIAGIGDERLNLSLFWFENFTQLQYNYYFELTNINEANGMYGAVAQSKYKGAELNVFDYYMQDLRNLAGVNFRYNSDYYALSCSYSESKALSQALYDYDESLLQLSIEALIGAHYLELGGSLTGENGLLAMIQLGSFMSGQFYLSNQVDRENAKNGFMRYIYANTLWRFELLGGYTSYDNTFLAIADNLYAYEADGYVGYKVNKALSINLGIMAMRVADADPIGVSQNLVTLDIGYYYESF